MDQVSFKMQGIVDVTVLDKNNNVKQHFVTHNRVVDTGLNMIASLIAGKDKEGSNYISGPTHMAFGTGSNQVVAGDTKLQKEVFRKAFTSVKRTKNTVEFQCTIDVGEAPQNVTPITEVGIFNGSTSSAVMMNRCCFAVVNITPEDVMLVKWSVTILPLKSRYDKVPT